MGDINYTVLKDRILRFDGANIVDPNQIPHLLLCGVSPKYIKSSEDTEDIEKFNRMSDVIIEIYNEDETNINLDYTWNIPKSFLELNIRDYFNKFITVENKERITAELEMVEELKVENEIRSIIFTIAVLKENKVVYGVGRGSSCASYLLFLIGVHSVDPLKYNIPMEEFFHV
jgi:DNA polymerase III alpha subunit